MMKQKQKQSIFEMENFRFCREKFQEFNLVFFAFLLPVHQEPWNI